MCSNGIAAEFDRPNALEVGPLDYCLLVRLEGCERVEVMCVVSVQAVSAQASVEWRSGARERSGGAGGRSPSDKTDSARQPGPVLRAPGRPHLSARRRWVPPSSLRLHDVPDAEAKHDVIFRKVRGILNKLTPEKFQKLSDDLLALELDSDKVLKGVILLIFEKALDEPKYSSMYAQLCKRLSEEAPNLEPPGQPCTFKLLLLNKCRTEFENRAQAFAAFEDRQLPPEDEERRHLAKCKMLGNIKFIGELGKLEILAESILHRCIQNLLARRAAAEHHEDLECLAQLVRTCGRVLDSARGRGLMDQYFARIDTLAASRELAPRIRFMLRDVGELRRGGWVPRPATAPEGPVPIQQLRGDEEPPPRRDLFRAPQRRPLDDVLAGLSLSSPAAPLPPDKLFPNGFGRDAYRQRSAPGYFPRYKAGGGGGGNKADPPRPHKARLAAAAPLDDVQMRPGAYSLMYTANRLSRPPPAPLPLAPMQQNVLTPAFSSAPSLIKEPAITIKPAPDKKDKPKKDKGMNKEEACRIALETLDGLTSELEANGERAEPSEPTVEASEPAVEPSEPAAETSEHVRRLQDLQLPDKLLRRVVVAILESALTGGGSRHAAAARLLRAVRRSPLLEPLRGLLATPHPRLPALLANLVAHKLLALQEVGSLCEGAAHAGVLLDTLQELAVLLPPLQLQDMYNDSKINLCQLVSAESLGPELALEALERRGLAALEPALHVQAQLQKQLAAEPRPHLLYRWIKTNVDASVRSSCAFVSTLVGLVAGHVTGAVGGGSDKAALDQEKALFAAYAPLLTALLQARPDLQLAAVYAVQLHAHRQRYPKGLLLRWFMYLYNLEVCEEDAFLRWREDVTDHYPGKGEALFQVNAWLTWLQQQESEEEEAED